MKIATIIARFSFGLPILFFGLFGLFVVMRDPHSFLNENEGFSEAAKNCLLAMWDSQFLMPSVCVVHALAGLMVIANRWVGLGLAIHLPISIQMVLFHLVLDPGTGMIAYVVFLLNLFLIYRYRELYAPLLKSIPDRAS